MSMGLRRGNPIEWAGQANGHSRFRYDRNRKRQSVRDIRPPIRSPVENLTPRQPAPSHLRFCLSLFGCPDHSHPKRERIKRVEVFAPVVLVSLSSTTLRLLSPPTHLSSSLPLPAPYRPPKGPSLPPPKTHPLFSAA